MSINKRKLEFEKTSLEDGQEKQSGGERLPRAAKRKKINPTNNDPTDTTVACTLKITEPSPGTSSGILNKARRQTWTTTAIDSFFEGLAEHGKSFGKILAFMQSRHKKKHNEPFISNLRRNQVRFFYYRTWHKVSTLLSLAVKEHHSPSQCKKSSTTKKTKPYTATQSDDEETEGEVIEGDTPFDISLDEDEATIDKPNIDDTQQHQVDSITFRTPANVIDPSPCNLSSVEAEQDYETFKEPPLVVRPTEIDPQDDNEGEGFAVDEGIIKTEKKKDSLVEVNGKWQSLDLVAMICYSKLKQKYQGDKSSFSKRLYELVYRGLTTIRIKGKRKLQIKIPNCPALRNDKGPHDIATNELTQSDEVSIELRPHNISTWIHIQQLSLNPRLRLNVSLSRTIEDVYSFIANKWHISFDEIFQTLHIYTDTSLYINVSSTMTIRELLAMVNVNSNKLSLQYELHHYEPNITQSLSRLLTMVEFLASKPPPTAVVSDSVTTPTAVTVEENYITPPNCPASETTPILASAITSESTPFTWTTPTNYSSHTVSSHSCPILSPTVKEYMKSLAKRSPHKNIIKSPLTKYKRLQKCSPLKFSYSANPNSLRNSKNLTKPVKRTRLTFPSTSTLIPPPSPPTTVASSDLLNLLTLTSSTPTVNTNTGITTTGSISSTGITTDSITSTSTTVSSILPNITSHIPQSQNFIDLTYKEPAGSVTKQTNQKQHLVTLSKNSLMSTGSFGNLRLNELFQSVHENLKDTEPVAKEHHTQTQVKQTEVATSKSSLLVIPKGASSILSSVASPDALQEAIKATTVNKSDSKKKKKTKSDDTTASDPSPLQLLASQVAIPTTAIVSSHTHDITVRPLATTSVAPFTQIKKPAVRRPKLATSINKQLQQRLVPKPLQYLPQVSLSPPSISPLLTTPTISSPLAAVSQLTTPPAVSSSAVIPSTIDPQLLQTQLSSQVNILVNMLQQQIKQQMQQQKTQSVNESTIPQADKQIQQQSSSSQVPIPDLTPSDLSLLHAPLSDEPYHQPLASSSDTVNELLKGLAASTATDQQTVSSLQRLSEETSDVLPTFAKAMIEMSNTTDKEVFDNANIIPKPTATTGQLQGSSSSSDNSLLQFIQGDNSELAAGNSDSNLRHIMENTDFTDMFSQLRDILKTPDKTESNRKIDDTHPTTDGPNDVLDIFNSPFKDRHSFSNESQSSSVVRNLLEENSVDYINKFKELATAMSQTTPP